MARFSVFRGGKSDQQSDVDDISQPQEIQEIPTEKVPSSNVKELGATVDVQPVEKREFDSSDESQYDFDSAEFKKIPELVRTVVGFEDDPSLPVLTFRSILLSSIFCIVGSVVSQLSYFRTTTAPFPVFFVILASDPLGRFLARVLPDYKAPLGKWPFSLNPGPWSGKEHAIVGIAANAGSQDQWATYLPTNAVLYYGITMNPALALFFGWGASLLGFASAAMVRKILIDDPEFIFPLSLQQVTLYRSMETKNNTDKKRAHDQMRVFWILLLATFVWQFLPEYLFPFVASLAPLCWFASRNHTVNFIGAGRGGMGLLNIALNWSNITSTVITHPYSVQVIIFAGFVLKCWILIPIAYFGNLWGLPTYDIMSNEVFQKNGSSYPFNDLIYIDSSGMQHINETKYEEVGLAYSGAQYTWQIFMWVASYMSSYVWCAFFLGPKIYKIWKARKQAGTFHQDRLRKWAALTLVPIVMLLGIVVSKKIYMPIWTYFVALEFGAAATLPVSFVYAMSGFSIKVGYFNELVYGLGSSRHPLGQLAYRIISGNVWYDARVVIGIQIIANMLALPINYGMMRWVLATKFEYVSGQKEDPLGQWTGQDFQSYYTAGIQFALPILWGVLAGACAPALMWILHRRFPRARFDLWNTTIFFASAAVFYANLSTGPFTTFLVGMFTDWFLFRYRRVFWNKWAYISGAALDTGFNANLLFIFILLGSTGAKMVHW
ncbi:OPT oligopeptide transporter protein-domain-containing protein [Aspergillus venezuelensis]